MTTLPKSASSPIALLIRPRLLDRFASAARRRITLCVGRAGCGKSTAVRQHLDDAVDPVAVLVPSASDVGLWRFARSLADAIWMAPSLRRSFAAVYDQFSTNASASAELARWFATHLRDCTVTIVLDNFAGVSDPAIVEFLSLLLEREDLRARWIVCSRNPGLLPVPRWMALELMEMPIDETELLFTPSESERYNGAKAFAATAGLPLRERALSLHWSQLGLPQADPEDAVAQYVDVAYAVFPQDVKEFLKDALLLSALDSSLLHVLGHTGAESMSQRLQHEYDYLFEPLSPKPQFHPAATTLLLDRFSREDGERRTARIEAVGETLERLGRPADAMRFYERWSMWDRLHGLVEKRGLELTEAGAGDVVFEALRAMPESLQSSGATANALRALAESRNGRYDTAEAWFLTAIQEASDATRDRITYLYACDILRRHRVDCVDLFEQLIERMDAGEAGDFAAEVRSAASEAYMIGARPDDAKAAIEAALASAAASQNESLRARVYARAAYTFLFLGNSEKAQSYALEAARSAEQSGSYIIATGAYSILYQAAYEEDRVLDALHFVGLLSESAVRCGNLDFHLYGLIAAHGIETERRNLEGLRKLYASLREFEVQYDSRVAVEELIPSEALHATWDNDFERAYEMLAPTIVLQQDSSRRALRTAEVALYAAAAGRMDDALRYLDEIELDEEASGIYVARAILNTALARALLGEPQAAAILVETAVCDRPRSFALKQATRSVLGLWAGSSDWKAVHAAFSELDKFHWGGFAAMLAALPAAAA